jgi:DNA-binding NtrC family response regulator
MSGNGETLRGELAGGGSSRETEPPGSAARPSAPHVGVKPRVLIIDDEPLLGQTLRLGLEDSFEVVIELRGRAGLERMLSKEDFQLVFCDLSLPDISGMEIFAQTVEQRPELARVFVIMTGGAVTDEAYEFYENYTGPILEKPFSLSTVERLALELINAT